MKNLELEMSYAPDIPYYSFENTGGYITRQHAEFTKYDTQRLRTKSPLKFAIGDYATAPYEWDGVLFAMDTERNWYKWECGHCSCYWPLERGESGIFTQDEIEKLMEPYTEMLEYAKKNLFNQP